MGFEFKDTDICGLKVIEVHMAPDERGIYRKYYEKNIYKENGIDVDFTESSDIFSRKGVIRGLHYQTINSQAKLLHVIKGKIYDVALDLRPESETFGQWKGIFLNENDNKAIFIPEGFAHGFLALEEDTIFSYQCSGKYIPSACGGIIWNDTKLNITWPLNDIKKLILSDKDKNLGSFEKYCDSVK